MSTETIFIEKFREILEVEGKEILPDDKFREYEEWSSLVFLSLIAMIDEEFDVIIEGKDFKQLITVEDIINAIKDRQS
jgi:acyl carrier protein